MSKLLQRLSDAGKSGIYRAPHGRDIVDAVRGSKLGLARIDLEGALGKDALLERIAKALAFPKWFGGNWDALEECLADLACSGTPGHVILFENPQDLPADARAALADVLAATVETWKERRLPFFAVFVEPASLLPELYRGRK